MEYVIAESGMKISIMTLSSIIPDWHQSSILMKSTIDISYFSGLINLSKIWSSSSSGLMTGKFLPPCSYMDDLIDFHVFAWRKFLSHADGIFLPWSYMDMEILMSNFDVIWLVELLCQKGRRSLYFGFEDIDFQTYRCPKWPFSVWKVD